MQLLWLFFSGGEGGGCVRHVMAAHSSSALASSSPEPCIAFTLSGQLSRGAIYSNADVGVNSTLLPATLFIAFVNLHFLDKQQITTNLIS